MRTGTSTGRRSIAQLEIDRATTEIVGRLGRSAKSARTRRHLTQAELGERLGISQSEMSRIEAGRGDAVPIRTWVALGDALGLRSRFALARDWQEGPADAGHLAIQELMLGLARSTGANGSFKLPIRPNDPSWSIDVFVRDDARRRLIVEECWNTIGNVGEGGRSFDRKVAAARDLAVAIGGDRPYEVGGVWIVRATKRNRELLARYPEVFARRFPGSSAQWVAALTRGVAMPSEPGLVWCNIQATELFAWRRRRNP